MGGERRSPSESEKLKKEAVKRMEARAASLGHGQDQSAFAPVIFCLYIMPLRFKYPLEREADCLNLGHMTIPWSVEAGHLATQCRHNCLQWERLIPKCLKYIPRQRGEWLFAHFKNAEYNPLT